MCFYLCNLPRDLFSMSVRMGTFHMGPRRKLTRESKTQLSPESAILPHTEPSSLGLVEGKPSRPPASSYLQAAAPKLTEEALLSSPPGSWLGCVKCWGDEGRGWRAGPATRRKAEVVGRRGDDGEGPPPTWPQSHRN